MANRVELDFEGFRALRSDPAIQTAVTQAAQQVAARANGLAVHKDASYEALPARASEYGSVALVVPIESGTSTQHVRSVIDERENHTLEKAANG